MIRIYLILTALVLTTTTAFAQDPEYTLNIGTIAPDNTPWATQLLELKERFERESEGRMRVRVFLGSPDGELSLVRQCQDGQYEAVGVSTGSVAAVVPQMGVFELPFLFESLEQADRILDDVLYEPISALMAENGFKFYLYSENGYRNFATSGQVIHRPSDLGTLQMRSQESWIHEEMYNALGGNPVRIAVPEVITALNTGNVQGFDNTPLFAFASSWYQAIDTWTVSNHIYQPAVIFYNADWYESLPSDLQAMVTGNVAEETRSGRRLIRALTPALIQNLENAGITVYNMTDEERSVFREATRGVHHMFRERVEGGSELLDLIVEAQAQ
jgi:TRAP-type C4-dicarboxylate transport system substrate-binding protein